MQNVVNLEVEDLLARDVIDLGNACDGATTEALCSAKERELGRAIVRPWEEPDIGETGFAPSYALRKKELRKAKSAKAAKPELIGDPAVLLDELTRLRRMSWRNQKSETYAPRINELEAALGLPVTDFATAERPKNTAPGSEFTEGTEKRFAQLQALSWQNRIEAVIKEESRELLTKLMYDDPAEKVRMAALGRLTAVAIAS